LAAAAVVGTTNVVNYYDNTCISQDERRRFVRDEPACSPSPVRH